MLLTGSAALLVFGGVVDIALGGTLITIARGAKQTSTVVSFLASHRNARA